jgi:uncharacterized damage-inducible protein DinB
MFSRDILVAQLKACHDQDSWFVSLQNAIRGLTDEQASWKNKGHTNSIQEIINHLIHYNQRYLNRLKGISNGKGLTSNDLTFSNIDLRNWQTCLELIDQIMSEWISLVQECADDRLDEWAPDLTHLTIHTAYHIGQIVHIRKEQGSWNPTNGVH